MLALHLRLRLRLRLHTKRVCIWLSPKGPAGAVGMGLGMGLGRLGLGLGFGLGFGLGWGPGRLVGMVGLGADVFYLLGCVLPSWWCGVIKVHLGDHNTTSEVVFLPWKWLRRQIPALLGLRRHGVGFLPQLLMGFGTRRSLGLLFLLSTALGWPRLWCSC